MSPEPVEAATTSRTASADVALSTEVRATAERLLLPFTIATFCSAFTAWLLYVAAARSSEFDLSGNIDAVLPLLRTGILAAPIMVAVRGAISAAVVWLVIGALNTRIAFRTAAVVTIAWLPLLDAPALVDAIRVLLDPSTPWSDAHIPLGMDAFVREGDMRLMLLTRALNIALLGWIVTIAAKLAPRVRGGYRVTSPAAIAAAIVLVLLPLLRSR